MSLQERSLGYEGYREDHLDQKWLPIFQGNPKKTKERGLRQTFGDGRLCDHFKGPNFGVTITGAMMEKNGFLEIATFGIAVGIQDFVNTYRHDTLGESIAATLTT